MKQTWTGLPDVEPIPIKRAVELEQAENMKALIGAEHWEALVKRERRDMSLDPDESYFWLISSRGSKDRVRDLLPSEMEPRNQLRVFLDPAASQTAKDAALESFKWPWPKLSFETLAKLDSLKPDHEPGTEAAIRYLNKNKVEDPCVPIRATVVLPLLITITIIMALALGSAAIRGW